MKRNVLISGGSGFLGKHISQQLMAQGDQVAWLSRSTSSPQNGVRTYVWDTSKQKIDPEAVRWATHIINLAGENIGETRWTKKGKALILNSRTDAVKTLIAGLKEREEPIRGFVGVSGVGYYGGGTYLNNENTSPGNDFPAQVAMAWEDAYSEIIPQFPKHKAIIRLAPVLSVKSGALPKIMQPIRLGFGAPLGSGNQLFPWIHLEDAVEAFIRGLEWEGVYNVASPGEVDNKRVTEQLGEILNRPLWLPHVPTFALKMALGDRAELVTSGNRVSIQKLLNTGLKIRFPSFRQAVEDLLIRNL